MKIGSNNFTYTDLNGIQQNNKICDDFKASVKLSYVFSYFSVILITLTNHKVRLLVEEIIEWIGFESDTSVQQFVTITVLFCQFFNTAILLIFNNANMVDQGIRLFNGEYTDFNGEFY